MSTKPTDDFDLPDDVPPDPVLEARPAVYIQAEDLHLGAPVVTRHRPTWLDQNGPRPPGPGIFVLDIVIGVLGVTSVWLMGKAWIWAIFS